MIQTKSQESVKTYLQEIADRLASNHAAIMVGAGFSKNANIKFPDWNELGRLFFQKLNNEKEPGQDDHFLNPMKLANEFDALFGKNNLNNFIKANIPDKEYSPSQLLI